MILPSTDQLQSLPQWALCAFAIRCARRVLPLYHVYVRRAPEHLVALERALELSESRANSGRPSEPHVPSELQGLDNTLGDICEDAMNMEADADGAAADDPFGQEARAYVTVAIAAQVAFEISFHEELYSDTGDFDTCETIAAALSRISTAGAVPEDKLARAFAEDFAAISEHVQAAGHADDDGVSQREFGPL